jgi:protein-S-isoprenylcysteine O-methyltransferase Ste14
MAHLPPALLWLTSLCGVAWVGLELRHSLNFRPEATQADRGSRPVIGIAAAIGILLALWAARAVPALAVENRTAAAWCGLGLLVCAIVLRQWSVRTLGHYFTFTVQTSTDQRVVTTGPYRYVRHPAYSALLLAAAAAGLYVGNWLSVLAFILSVAAGLAYRIIVEERALTAELGSAYREYAATHKRLVPFVW